MKRICFLLLTCLSLSLNASTVIVPTLSTTGTGLSVLQTSPTLITPSLGDASTIGLTITFNASVINGVGKIIIDGSNLLHFNSGSGGTVFNDSINTKNIMFLSEAGGVTIGSTTDAGVGNIATAGTLKVKSGTNLKSGTFTLVSGSKVVANTSVTANSVIIPTLKTASGTRAGVPDCVPTAGVGFTATGAATDNGTYNFVVIEVN